ncbi:hypothetical protein BH11ARM1_BH11ARM1_05210 [soil metagenome]
MVKKIFALVMVISVLGVFLGGCGSGDKAADPATPAADTTKTGS